MVKRSGPAPSVAPGSGGGVLAEAAEALPVLVAALSNEQAAALEDASRAGRHVWVPLKWPPASGDAHMLEVYTPDTNEPLCLLAEPLGTSSERGFALRVYPWDEASSVETADDVVDADALIGRTLAGRFEITSALGEGSIGAVYRARHIGLGIDVAVKVLHEAFQRDAAFCDRFYAEALALSRLDHSNLIHIHDFGQEQDGLLYLSMAFVDGVTLRTLFEREGGPLETKRLVAIMLQVCAGLGHAHGRGLIHRDVKPDNVMIVEREDDDGNVTETVKVLDFGFAVPPKVSGEVLQRLAGTPVYMSPEQCLGEELDARSDVYACGVMLYELSTGTLPFVGPDADAIRRMHVSEPARAISERRPDIDPRFDRIVTRALSKSREARQQNMQELRAELKSFLGASPSRTDFGRVIPGARPSEPVALASPPLGGDASFDPRPHYLADEIATRAEEWLEQVISGARPLGELDGAVRILAQRADLRALRAVSNAVRALHAGASAENQAARHASADVMRRLTEPEVLAPVAQHLLLREEDRDVAMELVSAAGVAGAFAVYGARTKLGAGTHARIAFVKAMRTMGEPSLPVIRAALERIHGAAMSGANEPAVDLAEDLLLSAPPILDEVAGHLVIKFALCTAPPVRRATARALPRVWGLRAKPTLLELAVDPEEGVRVAALVGLREIDGVDSEVIACIERLLETETSERVRSAASDTRRAARQG